MIKGEKWRYNAGSLSLSWCVLNHVIVDLLTLLGSEKLVVNKKSRSH